MARLDCSEAAVAAAVVACSRQQRIRSLSVRSTRQKRTSARYASKLLCSRDSWRLMPKAYRRRRVLVVQNVSSLTQGITGKPDVSRSRWELKRTIRRPDLRQIVPLADTTIYEMEQRGEFPKRFNLSPRCVVWDLDEVQAWVEERRRASSGAAAPIRARGPDVHQRRARPVKVRDQG